MAECLVNVCGWIDEFDADVLFFEIVFDEGFNGESFAFEKVFSEGNALLALSIDWADDESLNSFDNTENAGVFLEELTGWAWSLFFPHFFKFLFDWLINQIVVLFQGIELNQKPVSSESEELEREDFLFMIVESDALIESV